MNFQCTMPVQTASRTNGASNFAERRERAKARKFYERSPKLAPPFAGKPAAL
jgi:hypothetical protein